MTKRIRGWSVSPADFLYVAVLVAGSALMWNGAALSQLAYAWSGGSVAVTDWTVAVVLLLWVLLSVVGCWGLLTEKRSYRKPGAHVEVDEKESVR